MLDIISYRASEHYVIDYSPAIYLRELRLRIDLLYGAPDESKKFSIQLLKVLQEKLNGVHVVVRVTMVSF